MQAAIKFNESTFTIKNRSDFRAEPEKEFQHRLKTREHLAYLQDMKLFDVSDSRWAKATVDGEVVYGHEYNGSVLTVRLKTRDGKLTLSHNEDGPLDRHLMDNPGESTVYSITSSNNGLESTHTFAVQSAGVASLTIVFAALVFTVNLANGAAAAQAAIDAGEAVATFCGVETTIFPGVGIVIAVLAFIGVWIAYAVGREIMLNLIYENRSSKTITLVDHYVYNIGDSKLIDATLSPLQKVGPFDFYSDVVVNIDNYSKIRGIGVSMKFQKEDGSSLIICIRNDIYHDAQYTIAQFPKGDTTSAEDAYNRCSGALRTSDFAWGDLIVKNRLDEEGFQKYNFSGIISFHDAAA
ncbi:hypothetical protein AB3662_22260 [Sorangium cellulosum]|uniref:hypothetical protein n=1 Tax=Sorangium cellulosum TaxID=56 RepID=UPI003D9A2A7F